MAGLSRSEIYTVVNRYIGVQGGYLGDFSYRTHAEFYLEFCDLDGVNPYELGGTTRSRFIQILTSVAPDVQAQILRGVLKKYPAGSDQIRTLDRHAEILRIIGRLEGASPVASPNLRITIASVERAIADAETLIRSSGATSGVDRIHTALHGYIRAACEMQRITCANDASLPDLFSVLRREHPQLQRAVAHSGEIEKILRAFGKVLESLNTLRNRGSVAHPNDELLEPAEAFLAINAARSILHYLDSKIGAEALTESAQF